MTARDATRFAHWAEKEGREVLMELRGKKLPMNPRARSSGGCVNATNYLRIAQPVGAAKVLATLFTDEAQLAASDEQVPGRGAPAPGQPGGQIATAP
jgi:hypothetical protein